MPHPRLRRFPRRFTQQLPRDPPPPRPLPGGHVADVGAQAGLVPLLRQPADQLLSRQLGALVEVQRADNQLRARTIRLQDEHAASARQP